MDLGAEPFLIASVLTAVEAQRIVRRICPSCKTSYSPPPEIVSDFKNILGNLYPQDLKELVIYKGKGCKECNNSGYLGRIGIYETIMVTSSIAKMVLERSSAEAIEKQAVSEGMITMFQDGYLKILNGITTLEEILRVAKE
ncbi:hypothetical protein A3D03_06160 [Candidatus Gottesmanbacteria bacterium RIFCSPHIGHO2_02_FULL_40_13]|uniref:Bacterial type II secretion system protein E domain-containing protein n=1 Tax=Candidatus Gottesmanbacteria bacterium RIFCSPHIGHO2_02_FULL_40_13 TaxID=1798384 RepID=A0A1F6A6N3_9BACT|nr:MAG: hypothetical protein A3D03_06160 [Candidatus Gottesmanbacteria bacterium RIFCSPHIGHO2_02_FULL_40_13]